MAYSRKEFALDLKEKIKMKESIKSISEWAIFIYDKHKDEIDRSFERFLFDLEVMGMAPQYEFTHEQLNGFADRLLAGELDIDPYNRKLSVITRQELGLLLKKKIKEKEDVYLIGQWAFSVYLEYIGYLDKDFNDCLSDLSAMETPGFELSYEELDQIADKLIAGQQVIKIYGVVENPFYKNR